MWSTTPPGGFDSRSYERFHPEGQSGANYAPAAASFSSHYYDRQYEAHSPGASLDPRRTRATSHSAILGRGGAPSGARLGGLACPSCRCTSDLAVKGVVRLGFLAVLAGSVAVTAFGIETMVDPGFTVFSLLAWELWYPSFWAIALVVVMLAICAAMLAAVGAWAGLRDSKSFWRLLLLTSGTSGVLLLGLALLGYLYGQQAEPAVVRTVNLICQDPAVWGCTPASAYSARLLDAESALPAVPGARRRLMSPPETAVAYIKTLEVGAPPGPAAAIICPKLSTICAPPLGFLPVTACVCSGDWDYAPQPATTPAPTGFSHDPWVGTLGAYCDDWGSTGERWCFVASPQRCHRESIREHRSSTGGTLTKSSGPCTADVGSRSAVVLEGLDSLHRALAGAAALGCLMLLLPCVGALVQASPLKAAFSAPGSPTAAPKADGGFELLPSHARFEDAQKEAVKRLTDSTPEDLKLQLYSYYNQATRGDVQGERPSFFSRRERAKYDAWEAHLGLSRDLAIEAYIRTVGLIV